ncbi:hypothetical protein TNIN_83331 [Trichonephila inaurata madagascariensis]|uniref:Uncharacterized protein n=1 Tax=Trichonephila inaurata madagascariensis TaxID=2747483 RepID=A0A8X7CT75_9ARAC|nr:hypothetical protein TNIN_83331 [Trichonephila inaurata madagascariensis]
MEGIHKIANERNLYQENIPFSAASTISRSEISGSRYIKSKKNQRDQETANDCSVWKVGKASISVTGRHLQQIQLCRQRAEQLAIAHAVH